MTDTAFEGEIRVASRIVDYLSSGLYNSPAACLKELVNNSYDAEATKVEVFVKPDADRIVISDDGVGMSKAEFVKHFERVSESHKRDTSDTTDSGRPKVGKIGIGFIAANELCDLMEIISTQTGSTELLRVEVNFKQMRLEPAERRRRDDGEVYAKGDYAGTLETAPADNHFTHVLLKQVRGEAKDIFTGIRPRDHQGEDPAETQEADTESLAAAPAEDHTAGDVPLYGLDAEEVRHRLEHNVQDWADLDAYSQTMLRVGLNVPVQYPPEWHHTDDKKILARLTREVSDLGFTVRYDGSDLRKPVVLRSGGAELVRRIEIDGRHVSARGYFYARHGVLRPEWLNGVLIRIRNAAVGDYDDGFLGFDHSTGTIFQRWISAELWADDRLERALNIDRRTLRITDPAYVELQREFHKELLAFIGEVRRELYSKPSTARRKDDALSEVSQIRDVIDRSDTRLPAAAKRQIREIVRQREKAAETGSKPDIRTVLRRYGVAEIYELTLQVAKETLPPKQYESFAAALAKRLLG